MTTTDDRPMSLRFKEGCADLHDSAEAADFARRMVNAELSRDDYIQMLRRSLPIHEALDRAILSNRESVPQLKALITDEQLHGPHIRADLAYFNITPDDIQPANSAIDAIARINQAAVANPLQLLAYHYVREGANNGNHFISRKIRQNLNLPDTGATHHIDPYGPAQREKWGNFKTTLDSLTFSPTERDQLVESARDMFGIVMALHEDLSARTQPA